jgi:hypothetical protein
MTIKTIACVACVLAGTITSGCGSSTEKGMLLQNGQSLEGEACTSRQIEDVVLVFHWVQCHACVEALPILEEIDRELPNREFRFIEVIQDADVMEELQLVPEYTPTIVANCKVTVGLKTKQKYLAFIGR